MKKTGFYIIRDKFFEQKARKVMGMLKRGIKFTPTQPDIMTILEKLRERRQLSISKAVAGKMADI